MATERLITTRRQMLAASLTLPVAVLATGLPATAQEAAVDRTAWDRAIAIYVQAKAESDAFDAPFWQIDQRYEDACKAIPHTTLRPDPYSGIMHALSTANASDVAHAHRSLRGVVRWDDVPSINEHFALCKELVAADDARKTDFRRIDAKVGYTLANDQYDKLVNAMSDAESALIELPAPDAPALLWKLDKLLGEDSRSGDDRSGSAWCAAWLDATIADARRLLTREA